MKILELRAMRGPNYWSVRRHKLIVMKLDLEELEEKPSNKIDGFPERIEAMFPDMHSHRCSRGYVGGFFERVREGTWMGHIIEHIALEIQTMAGMDCGFGRTRSTGEYGIYYVVFNYMEEEAGKYSARSAVRIAEALIRNKEYDLDSDIQEMREIRENERLGPSTGCIVQEAVNRDIPYLRLNRHSLVQLGYGINQKRIQATVSSTTSNIAVEIACDKEETKSLLNTNAIPVAKGDIIRRESSLEGVIKDLGFPLVIKPSDGNHGRGITININNYEDALRGFHAAKEKSHSVIIERYVEGRDFRVLVINYKFVAASLRTPAAITGDGKSTIQELIDKVNSDPRRGYGHEKVLTLIKVDQMTEDILRKKGLGLDSVIKKDDTIYLKNTANLSTGGTATDFTDNIHPYNIFMTERISRIIGLDICGIDIMAEDLSRPINENGGVVLEVNAGPGFRMHIAPTKGLARNIAEPVIDMLYPPGSNTRIPIIAITGTNGKTTTTRLIAHIVKNMGFKVGFTTSDGIYIQNRMLDKGDCTGPVSAEFVLKDPTVNYAVLETARGGILRAGLGFHKCDVAVVTNIASDHLGMKGINTIEDMAKVKAVVVESVSNDGYAILNADDDLVFNMRTNAQGKIALFSMEENNPRILKHCNNGGLAAIVENGYVTICKGNWKIRVDKIVNIPLTYSGKANFNVQNVLGAILSVFVRGFKIEDIRVALETFIPSPTLTPGRMNLFEFNKFKVLLDYAHNPAGFEALKGYLSKVEESPKVGIIAGVGDRRDEDLYKLGVLAAQMFDEIIIRHDKNLRGRNEEELVDLLKKGISSIDKKKDVNVIRSEVDAVKHALTNAKDNSFIVICSDVIPEALDTVMALKEKENLSLV